jgi:hypothetical protein
MDRNKNPEGGEILAQFPVRHEDGHIEICLFKGFCRCHSTRFRIDEHQQTMKCAKCEELYMFRIQKEEEEELVRHAMEGPCTKH